MSEVAIEVKGLAKRYRIGMKTSGSLRETLVMKWDQVTGSSKPRHDDFWALNDISFNVLRGDVLGIIGKNGAGKSTLLKILSRITEPTAGHAIVNGRVASLLEVGTGFHPELTGRENVFLNGTILGMTRKEIKKKFDEIVAFSGVDKFIDTPVKHYSSGMYVRLAFSVAAHLDSEIMIIDEVLAVGDAEFQKKCLGKMNDVAKDGKTVLFVSHNMGSINSLCSKCMLLNKGKMTALGDPSSVIMKYYSDDRNMAYYEPLKPMGDSNVDLLSGWLEDESGKVRHSFNLDESLAICMKYRIKKQMESLPVPNFHVFYTDGSYVCISNATETIPSLEGTYISKCLIPSFFFNNRTYFVGLAVTLYHTVGYDVCFFEQNALSFIIRDEMNYKEMKRYNYNSDIPGVVRPLFPWKIEKTD